MKAMPIREIYRATRLVRWHGAGTGMSVGMRRARSPVRPRAHVVPSYEWSPKQQRALSMWKRDSRYVLLDGSVRSGKTFSGMYGWLGGIARNFAGYDFLMSCPHYEAVSGAVPEANLAAVVP